MKLYQVLALACACGVGVGAQTPSATQATPDPKSTPRTADGRPDLNGVWQAFVTANVDLQDHEAQAGPHTELIGAYGGWPAGQPELAVKVSRR